MIEPLTWDSSFFGRKMGVLTDAFTPSGIAADMAAARAGKYEYLQARPPVADATAIRALEAAGFYLTDLGVTWATGVGRYLASAAGGTARLVRGANEADIPWLQDIVVGLFPLSRFYHDPFFTNDEGDRMHQAWLANSVRGLAADVVLIAPEAGFVTGKIARDGAGEIVLIAVVNPARARGTGRALMTAALGWFQARGVTTVRVKTQVKNLQAMNFYHRLGFDLHDTDMTMGCILSTARA